MDNGAEEAKWEGMHEGARRPPNSKRDISQTVENTRQAEILHQMGFTAQAARHQMANVVGREGSGLTTDTHRKRLMDMLPEDVQHHLEGYIMSEAERLNEGDLDRPFLEPILDRFIDTMLKHHIEGEVREVSDKQGGRMAHGEMEKRIKKLAHMGESILKYRVKRVPRYEGRHIIYEGQPLRSDFVHDFMKALSPKYYSGYPIYKERNATKGKRSRAGQGGQAEYRRAHWAMRVREIGQKSYPALTKSFRDKYG
jgi:hypothetical protein